MSAHVFCPGCGEPVPVEAGFCRACGTDMTTRVRPAAVEQQPCPRCAAPLPLDAQFCGACGQARSADEPAARKPKTFITFMEPAPSLPPVSPAPDDATEPLAPASPPPAAVSDLPTSELASAPPEPPAPDPPPSLVAGGPRRRLDTGWIIGIAAALILIGGGLVAALVLGGGSESPKPASAKARPAATPPAATTPAPTQAAATPTEDPDADLDAQVKALDELMQASEQGRAAAVAGETDAAVANRSKLLKDIERLRGEATDAQLKAGLASFAAAIRESLRQNRECGERCPAGDLERVNRLKREAVSRLNPLLREHGGGTYRSTEI